ncbi:hypothetical protein AJ79_05288 [Helicocarpus griseus UAMH5409]|uniref:FYVE-type domain-containing protein n=1 Tax=Helicocarpus griseus UAMH5409 TaxID=1447875 RepID=A0A2B7XQC0_9EURO|nr:hypothetical protein AJ79_05288 [Helicocarpus griseus UAMH5409]
MSTTLPSQSQVNNPTSAHGHPSPVNSASVTPANNSPTSPRLQNSQLHQLHLQSRQLRPPKSPLYVPAVLRPTERATKPSPLTPPRSVHGSLDSLDDRPETAGPITRRSTVESVKSAVSKRAEDEWLKDENLGEVTGTPTRDHWKADSASPTCDSPTCRSYFGLFLRRHHCRHCGHVFCSSHTPHTVPLDQNARFHPDGIPSRACDLCWNAYRHWDKARTARLNEIQKDLASHIEDVQDGNAGSKAVRAGGTSSGPNSLSPELNQDGIVASSVPRDWSWSTF